MGSPVQGTGHSTGFLRVMAFIDGEYLRFGLAKKKLSPSLNYVNLYNKFVSDARTFFQIYLTRIYYYDAEGEFFKPGARYTRQQVDAIEENAVKFEKQRQLHDEIRKADFFEVRLARITITGDGKLKQKGVDTLMAIDMISKAYDNHYDIAILLAGDDDFLDVIKAVKNAGRQVYGVFFKDSLSSNILEYVDKRIFIDDGYIKYIKTGIKD